MSTPLSPASQEQPAATRSAWGTLARFAVLVAMYVVIVHVLPRPAAIKPEGWRLLGIFAATVCGLIRPWSL
jgi:hypothetical protein